MRKIVFSMGVSLDGFIEGPNREIDWHVVDEDLLSYFNEKFRAYSAFLDGRVVHELMTAHWPTADQNPSASRAELEFAGIWRDMPKYVFSRTLRDDPWATAIMHDVVPSEIRALQERPGGDMVVGGAELGGVFLAKGLVDEVHVYVHPVLIGAGRPMFHDAQANLSLIGTRAFGNGVVGLHYKVLR